MKIIILILAFISLPCLGSDAQNLKPFVTDFCTSYREGTSQKPDLWKHCCVEHDLYFWAGGSLEDRKATDLRLKSCVESTGAIFQAKLIYLGVTLGGVSPIKFKSKQWGNAWENRQRHISLNEIETSQLIQYLEENEFELSSELKQTFKEQLNSRLDSI